jgi:hypothetical protein
MTATAARPGTLMESIATGYIQSNNDRLKYMYFEGFELHIVIKNLEVPTCKALIIYITIAMIVIFTWFRKGNNVYIYTTLL